MNKQAVESHPVSSRPLRGSGPDRNGLAVAALVLGIVGWVTSVVFAGGLFGVVGVALGVAAVWRARRTGVGRGMAVAGLVTSFLAIVVSVLFVFFFVWYSNKTQQCYDPGSFAKYRECVHRQFTGH